MRSHLFFFLIVTCVLTIAACVFSNPNDITTPIKRQNEQTQTDGGNHAVIATTDHGLAFKSNTTIRHEFLKRFASMQQYLLHEFPLSIHHTNKTILIYHNAKLLERPYRIIGTTQVSKYNMLGLKRHEETLQKMLRQAAASLGGDALIEFEHNGQNIQASVIVFEKVIV